MSVVRLGCVVLTDACYVRGLAQVGQVGGDAAVGWGLKKYALGPAWDFAKGLWSGGEVVTSGGEIFGPTLGEATSLLDVVEPVSSGLGPVSDFGPLRESLSGVESVSAIPDIPAELQQVADVNFEPITQGLSDATKRGIEEGISQVDGDPLMKVVEDSGKEGAQGFWQGLMDNPTVEVGGDALAYHSATFWTTPDRERTGVIITNVKFGVELESGLLSLHIRVKNLTTAEILTLDIDQRGSCPGAIRINYSDKERTLLDTEIAQEIFAYWESRYESQVREHVKQLDAVA